MACTYELRYTKRIKSNSVAPQRVAIISNMPISYYNHRQILNTVVLKGCRKPTTIISVQCSMHWSDRKPNYHPLPKVELCIFLGWCLQPITICLVDIKTLTEVQSRQL